MLSAFRRKALVGVCMIPTLALLGCGGSSDHPKVVPASGKVTFQGKPVAGAHVTFMKEGAPRAAIGLSDERGIYHLTTFDSNDGAIPGEHQVTVLKVKSNVVVSGDTSLNGDGYAKAMEAAHAAQKSGKPVVAFELPAKYADPKTSGLKKTISDRGPNTIDLDLTE